MAILFTFEPVNAVAFHTHFHADHGFLQIFRKMANKQIHGLHFGRYQSKLARPLYHPNVL